VLGFLAIFLYFLVPAVLQGNGAPYLVTLAVIAGLAAVATWRMWVWSRRPGWDGRHRLALASGVLGFFILVFAPILEAAGQINGKVTRGTAVFAVVFLLLLISLARRVARRERAAQATIGSAANGDAPAAIPLPEEVRDGSR
jgi:hypothetical protein